MNRLFQKLLVSPPLIIWGIIISPVILLGVSSAALSSRIFKENLIHQVEAQANNSATRINNYTQLIKAQAIAAGNFAVAEQYLSLLNHIHEPQTDLNKASKLLPQLQHYMRDQIVVGQHLDHIRYINKDAREIIRIDRDRKKFTLKDTSNRAYFHETMELQRGELYVSPINLNREGASGFLEEPHKPVVRIATPVYNLDNQIEGIFIANILADRIFDFADNQLLRKKYGTQLMIVNQEGYYLRHPNPAMEFGFDIGNDQLKLSIDNPTLAIQSKNNRDQKSNNFQIPIGDRQLWNLIKEQDNGILQHYELAGTPYIIIYRTVYLDENYPELNFKIIYLIPERFAFAAINQFTFIVLVLAFVCIFVLTYFSLGLYEANNEVAKTKAEESKAIIQREEAIKSNLLKSAFLSSMSHEIRTPLNGILGLTEILHSTELNVNQRDYLETIQKSGQHLLQLINEILDLSKIEAGEIQIDFQKFNLIMLIQSTFEIFQTQAHHKNIYLISEIDPNLSDSYIGDAFRLRQILTNLIGNAVKFTENGKIFVSVQGCRQDCKQCIERCWFENYKTYHFKQPILIKFSVKDTGIGMDEVTQAKIFSPFIQADKSTSRQYGGTGLGLTISKHLTQLLGGEIGVMSQVDQGSEFWFTLILDALPHGTVKPPVTPDPAMLNSASASFLGKKILVAEDNITNQKVIKLLLQRLGCVPFIVNDGQAVSEVISEDLEVYDLIFMDYYMPVLNGDLATREIRRDSRFKDLPIIGLTAAAMPEDLQKCLDAGMNDVVTKPFKLEDIQRVLMKWLPQTMESQSQ